VEIERQRLEEERSYRERQAQAQTQAKAKRGAGFASQNLVIEIQRSLKVLGYQPGPIDGSPGDDTKSAIMAYQRDQGLLETGQPSEALLAHMRQRGG
jgi:peptidoglycan hydrolase-like protein with peptidoglycan-binding domain